MRIVIRIAGLTAVLAIFYGLAALLPSGIESVVGFVAFASVAVGAFAWALRDGKELHLSEVIRDWLVVAFVVAVIWWVTLALFEGSDDVVAQLRLDFSKVLWTIGLIFVPALVGGMLGNASPPAEVDEEFSS